MTIHHFHDDIQGWFTFPTFYSQMVERFDSGAQFVEVGCWLGKSASYMAVEIINSGKSITLHCVDTWLGSVEHQALMTGKDVDWLFDEFKANMAPVESVIRIHRLPSVEAAKEFDDASLDLVFIDAAHDYDSVLADIKAWTPKVRQGGVLAGHDFHHTPVKEALTACFPGRKYNEIEDCWVIDL